MGSFRSPAKRRAEDQAVLNHENCPVLAQNEWIRYWLRLPESARVQVMAAMAGDDGKPEMSGPKFAAALVARRVGGIIDWCIFDEEGNEVPWDPARGAELIEGLPEAVIDLLDRIIGSGEPPSLAAPADPSKPDGETEGNASAGS